MIDKDLITVGYNKGEMDFGVNGLVGTLTYEQMRDLREMLVVAIGVAETTWKAEMERRRGATATNPKQEEKQS